MDWSKIKHFTKKEMQCPCGCKQAPMNEEFMLKLDELREDFGHPIYISSGYRCPSHNKKVGGVKGSYHTYGVAADIAIYGKPAYELLATIFLSFEGVGIKQKGPYNKRFIHIDKGLLANSQTKKRPAVFTY